MTRTSPPRPCFRGALRQRLPRSGLAVAAVLGCLQSACSTTYQPQPSGRVGLVIRHAAVLYVKDGREVPVGPLGGDLETLVAETPAARLHAQDAHTQLVVGIPAYLTGAVGVIVGIAVFSGPVGWIVIGAGASALATGLGFMGAGLTHVIDAVNLHNDARSTRSPRAAP